ncbi:MAG: DUF2946 family protein [Sphingomonadaceae bacterium]
MVALRSLLLRHRAVLIMLAVIALGLRALVPQGMMVEQGGDLTLTVSICRDAGLSPATMTLEIPRKAPAPDHPGEQSETCAFGALGQAATVPPVDVLLAALAFVMALALLPAPRIAMHRLVRLRPPLRGPPTVS